MGNGNPAQASGDMSTPMMTLLGVVGALVVALVLAVSYLTHTGEKPASAAVHAPSGEWVTGLGYQDAQKRLASHGVAVVAVVRVPSARHADTVVRTYPDGGTTLRPGDRVTLYVSSH